MSNTTFQPNIAIHPGETLEELLEEFGMSQVDISKRTGLTPKTINEIVRGKSSITPETALKLAAVFGTSTEFWNNLERQYQDVLSRLKLEKELEKEKKFLKNLSYYNNLKKLGLVEDTNIAEKRVKNLLAFFGVSSFEYIQETQPIAFRKAAKDNIDKEALAAWLRAGEIKGTKMKTEKFNKKKLISAIPKLRSLSRKSPEVYGKAIQDILAACGIAVVYMPYFEKTHVHGATRWLTSEKALIQLSLLYKWEDVFWFSLFHEIGHIIKHGKKDEFLEFKNGNYKLGEKKEKEANEFAKNSLIPENDLSKLKGFSPQLIKNFAAEVDIAPSIVAGRVAHELSIRGNDRVWKAFANLRTRLKLEANET